MIVDAIGMFQLGQKPNLLEDILPFLEALLAPVGHLFDGHALVGDIVAGVVDGAEAAVPDLAKIIEKLVRILTLE